MKIQAITLFPEMFVALTQHGVTGRAYQRQLWQFSAINPRQFANNRLGYIDDRPFGGGVGMIMQAPPLQAAIDYAQHNLANPKQKAHVIYLSPQGKLLNHNKILELSQYSDLILLCGRYEGVDERIITHCIDEEISVGDFVVSGGELPAMMLMDAILRFVPDVLGDQQSAQEDSFANGLLDYPHYTRPLDFQGIKVPDILLSGNHAQIALWRLEQSLKRTLQRRPDLLAKRDFIPQEARLLEKIRKEIKSNESIHIITKEKT